MKEAVEIINGRTLRILNWQVERTLCSVICDVRNGEGKFEQIVS
jgi:hypothetical protein